MDVGKQIRNLTEQIMDILDEESVKTAVMFAIILSALEQKKVLSAKEVVQVIKNVAEVMDKYASMKDLKEGKPKDQLDIMQDRLDELVDKILGGK